MGNLFPEWTPERHPRTQPKERTALSYHGKIGQFNLRHNYPIYLVFALNRSYHGINGQNILAFVTVGIYIESIMEESGKRAAP